MRLRAPGRPRRPQAAKGSSEHPARIAAPTSILAMVEIVCIAVSTASTGQPLGAYVRLDRELLTTGVHTRTLPKSYWRRPEELPESGVTPASGTGQNAT